MSIVDERHQARLRNEETAYRRDHARGEPSPFTRQPDALKAKTDREIVDMLSEQRRFEIMRRLGDSEAEKWAEGRRFRSPRSANIDDHHQVGRQE